MRKILIADDEYDITDMVAAEFNRHNFITFIAHNSSEAINLFEQHNFAACIIDMVMPTCKNGHVLEYLNSLKWRPVILAVTGFDDIEAQEAFVNRVHTFVRKPFKPLDLVQMVDHFLEIRGNLSLHETLSERELEVLMHINTGKSSKEIASLLFVSQRTVEKHRENISIKLQVKNTAELVSLR